MTFLISFPRFMVASGSSRGSCTPKKLCHLCRIILETRYNGESTRDAKDIGIVEVWSAHLEELLICREDSRTQELGPGVFDGSGGAIVGDVGALQPKVDDSARRGKKNRKKYSCRSFGSFRKSNFTFLLSLGAFSLAIVDVAS